MIVSVVMASSYTSAPLVLQKDTQRPCPCPPATRNITPRSATVSPRSFFSFTFSRIAQPRRH